MNTTNAGPGTHLQALLGGVGCKACQGCQGMAQRMDTNGVAWCRSHRDVVVNHMVEFSGAWGRVPGARRIAGKLVALAITRAENDLLRG